MSVRHLAPVTFQREPRSSAAAAVIARLYPTLDADGWVVLEPSGGRWVPDADGFLGVDLTATSGYRATVPAAGGFIANY